jgi:hypothetical protein
VRDRFRKVTPCTANRHCRPGRIGADHAKPEVELIDFASRDAIPIDNFHPVISREFSRRGAFAG